MQPSHSSLQNVNNLVLVPKQCLEKADGCTWKKHDLKFRQISHHVDPYGHLFFLIVLVLRMFMLESCKG